MGVKVLHTDIPNNKDIAAVKQKHGNYIKSIIATKVIIKFLALIWTLGNFIFNSKFSL